jgi:hypothetical protein
VSGGLLRLFLCSCFSAAFFQGRKRKREGGLAACLVASTIPPRAQPQRERQRGRAAGLQTHSVRPAAGGLSIRPFALFPSVLLFLSRVNFGNSRPPGPTSCSDRRHRSSRAARQQPGSSGNTESCFRRRRQKKPAFANERRRPAGSFASVGRVVRLLTFCCCWWTLRFESFIGLLVEKI